MLQFDHLYLIFQYLTATELIIVSRVSKEWFNAATSNAIWFKHLSRDFGEAVVTQAQTQHAKFNAHLMYYQSYATQMKLIPQLVTKFEASNDNYRFPIMNPSINFPYWKCDLFCFKISPNLHKLPKAYHLAAMIIAMLTPTNNPIGWNDFIRIGTQSINELITFSQLIGAIVTHRIFEIIPAKCVESLVAQLAYKVHSRNKAAMMALIGIWPLNDDGSTINSKYNNYYNNNSTTKNVVMSTEPYITLNFPQPASQPAAYPIFIERNYSSTRARSYKSDINLTYPELLLRGLEANRTKSVRSKHSAKPKDRKRNNYNNTYNNKRKEETKYKITKNDLAEINCCVCSSQSKPWAINYVNISNSSFTFTSVHNNEKGAIVVVVD